MNRRQMIAGALGTVALAEAPASALLSAAVVPTRSPGFTPLFDGYSLAGWTPKTRDTKKPSLGLWAVQNGVILGGQNPVGLGSYLVSDQAFADFELELDARTDWRTDTGIYVRTNAAGTTGFQVGLDYRPHGAIGGYFGNGLGSFHACDYTFTGECNSNGELLRLVPEKPSEPLDATQHVPLDFSPPASDFLKHWNLHGWNRFRIRSVGLVPRLTTWINGFKVAELDTSKIKCPGWDAARVEPLIGRSGHISFEVHNNWSTDWLGPDRWVRGGLCRWRNIAIKSL